MSDGISYKGKVLGWIHSHSEDNTTKFVLEMDGINGLEELCKLSDQEILEIEGMSPITYKDFRTRILERTKRIYLSISEYNLDFHP